MDAHDSLQADPTPALVAARAAIGSFERIAAGGDALPEPMRTQLIECFALHFDAAIQRAGHDAIEHILTQTLAPPTPLGGLPDGALDPQPLVPDGPALAIGLRLDDKGELTLGG